jgi:hypothetical protein
LSKKLTIYQTNGLGLGIDLPRLLCLSRNCWKPSKTARQSRQRVESRSITTADKWNHALSLLEEENRMNLKLLYLLFDSSLTVQQIDTCRGSSTLLKFQSSSCFLVYICLFSLLLHFNANNGGRKLQMVWNYCIPSWIPH